MVNKLQFFRSATPGARPSGLSAGEIAFNLTDKRLFVGNGSGLITLLDGSSSSVASGTGFQEYDLTNDSANAYTDQKIADLVDAAPNLLNTLNELAAALGDDPNFVTTVTTTIADVQSNLSAEVSRAQAAESSLNSSLSAEVARATAAEGVLQSNIDAEAARAEAAEADIAADLAAEVSRASSAESALEDDLAAEVARAEAAEGVLQDNIDAEAAARAAADSTEQSARIAADNTLQSNLDSETAARIAGDADKQAAIDAERARALSAESVLSARISDIENGIDLGTFGGIVVIPGEAF